MRRGGPGHKNSRITYLVCFLSFKLVLGMGEPFLLQNLARGVFSVEGLCQGMEGSALGEDKQTNRQPSPHTVYTLPLTLPLYKVFLLLIPEKRSWRQVIMLDFKGEPMPSGYIHSQCGRNDRYKY